MSILWFIIKIILFVLLAILLLLVIVIGTILLSPIRYEAYFSKYDEMVYDIKVRYLLGIRALFYLDGGNKKHQVSLFGKKIYKVNEQSNNQNVDSSEVEGTHEELEMDKGKLSQSNRDQVKQKETNPLPMPQEVLREDKQSIGKTKDLKDEIDHAEKKAKKNQTKTTHSVDIKEMLLDPLTYSATKHVLIGIWQVLKIIAPREWDFEVVVGTGEPADTGELIAKLTMLYPIYYKHGIIRGDYEKECLMGGFLVKGKIQLIQVVIVFIKIYFNQDVHDFVHSIKK